MTLRFRDEPPPIANAQCATQFGRCWLALFAVTLGWLGSAAQAADFSQDFATDRPSWRVVPSHASDSRVRVQRRVPAATPEESAYEEIQVATGRAGYVMRLEHELPPSTPLDDLSLSLKYRSNVASGVLVLRLVFPKQIDPRTKRPLSCYVTGDRYTETEHWQTLTVRPIARVVRERVARLRAELKSEQLNLEGGYFDRAVLLTDALIGLGAFQFSELHWTGYVSPAQQTIVPVKVEEPAARIDVQMRHDRMFVDGQPAILRFAPHHTEPISRLAALGLNVVWIDDFTDSTRLRALREFGLRALATPPAVQPDPDDQTGDALQEIEPFDDQTDGILAWYFGQRIPVEAKDELAAHARVIRAADRARQRPLMADIAGRERAFSRSFDAIGLSRHPLQTDFEIKDYRQFLTQKVKQLRTGTFVTTWLQTEIEPRPGNVQHTLVEPEQIRLLAYGALAAGCRGIGFWKTTAFDGDQPGARERELIIAIINQEIELLEPWLATRTVIDFQQIPLGETIKPKDAPLDKQQPTSTRLRNKSANLKSKIPQVGDTFRSFESDEIEMAIIHSPNGQLLLPMWYEQHSQFVPGLMAAKDIEILIPGIPDTATVWELTTTRVRSLKQERFSGGVRVRLENFDQLTALVVSTDPNFGQMMRQKIETMQDRSSLLWLSLAQAKWERTRAVDQRLQSLGVASPKVAAYLDEAATLITQADRTYDGVTATLRNRGPGRVQTTSYSPATGFDAVRQHALAALQALRVVQRIHWDRAAHDGVNPLFSPYSVCFQSLPEHWQFIERIGASPTGDLFNLLPGGDFEGTSTQRMVAAGWKHSQVDIEGVQAGAELAQAIGPHGVTLRLIAAPKLNADVPSALDGTPISVTTPPVELKAGHIVHISGSVRVPAPPSATIEGVSVTESLTGTRQQWRQTRGWERFEIAREVTADGPLTLKLTLHGLGEAQFDDLRIVTYPLRGPATNSADDN